MFRLLKKSGKRQLEDSVLQHKYALHFSSSRLFKGLFFTVLGLLLLTTSMVAFQHLVIENSIFVTFFVIFTSAFIPLFICALCKGKNFLICEKKKYVFVRAFLAVIVLYLHVASTFWISSSNSSLFLNLDSFFVPLIIYWMFRKKLSSLTWLGLLLSFLGFAALNPIQGEMFSLQGQLEMLLCTVSGLAAAGQIVISCYIIRHDPALRQILYTSFIGLLISGVGVLCSGWETPCFVDFIYMVFQGLVYAGIALLYLKVCDCIEPHVIASLNYLVPLLVLLINGFYGLYPLNGMMWVGCCIVLLGVGVVAAATRLQRKEEDILLA